MKIKKLTQSEINKIINLYTSGNVSSTHKLAKIFSVGHKKISDVLKSNGIEINKKGGQKKYGDIIITQNVVNKNLLENGKKIIAICKSTGKVFNDYSNKSGVLFTHIKQIIGDIEIPSQYKRSMLFKTTGKYWHEIFFDLKEIPLEHVTTRKCRYCTWETIDINNKSGYYENHLKKEHSKTLEEYLNEYPEDIVYHPTHEKKVKRLNFLNDKSNHVICEICGEKFGVITNTHLKNKHGITMKKYNELYGTPKIVSKTISNFLSENCKIINQTKTFNKSSKEEKNNTKIWIR